MSKNAVRYSFIYIRIYIYARGDYSFAVQVTVMLSNTSS